MDATALEYVCDELDLEVMPHREDFNVYGINKHPTEVLGVRIDFRGSKNAALFEGDEPSRVVGKKGMAVQTRLQPKTRTLVAILSPLDPDAPLRYHYQCATCLSPPSDDDGDDDDDDDDDDEDPLAIFENPTAAQKEAETEEQESTEYERKKLGDKLDLIVWSTATGYELWLETQDEAHTFEIAVDTTGSYNLKLEPLAEGKLRNEHVITGTIKPNSKIGLGKLVVDDWGRNACELRYEAHVHKFTQGEWIQVHRPSETARA